MFKTLYKNQTIQISINGKLTAPYYPERGVKQGDALSCILFILIMEILMRNLNINNDLRKLENKYQIQYPNALGYADDITILATNQNDVKKVFRIYERFTNLMELELNADKTEIMCINFPRTMEVVYRGKWVTINHQDAIRINGVTFMVSEALQYEQNWEDVTKKWQLN